MPNGIRKDKVARLCRRTEVALTAREAVEAWSRSSAHRLRLERVLDGTYWALPWSTWELVLAYSDVDSWRYVAERFDCDEFGLGFRVDCARRLGINAVFIVFDDSGRHCYAGLIVADPGEPVRIVFFECQTDGVVRELAGAYAQRFGTAFV